MGVRRRRRGRRRDRGVGQPPLEGGARRKRDWLFACCGRSVGPQRGTGTMGSGLEVLSAAMRALRAAADDSSGHHSSPTVNRAASAARRSVCVSSSGSCQSARRLGGRSAGLHCLNGTRSSPTGAFRQRVGNERGGDKRSVATTSYFSGTARTPLTPPSLSSASLPSARQASTSSSGSHAPDAPPALLRVSRLARAWVVPAGRRLATQARAPAVYARARSVSITPARVLQFWRNL